MPPGSAAYRASVAATGDLVGNQGGVVVRRCADGSTLLDAQNRHGATTLWLTRQQATDLALALMNAAHGASPTASERPGSGTS